MDDKGYTFQKIAEAFLMQFDSVYYVNLGTGNYQWFSIDQKNMTVQNPDGEDFFTDVIKNLDNPVCEEDIPAVRAFLSRENITQKLQENGKTKLFFRQMAGEVPVYHEFRLIKGAEGEHFILGITNVDAGYRENEEQEKLKEESLTFSRIAGSLATRYDSIYYIDAETGDYTRYDTMRNETRNIESRTTDEEHSGGSLEVALRGEDFFNSLTDRVRDTVVPEDRASVLAMFDREHLNILRKTEASTSVDFRTRWKGNTTYFNMRLVWVVDGRHIVVGVANVDARVRREKAQQSALRLANEQAERDGLTGVKNITAYQKYEAILQEQIDNRTMDAFSIAVFDLNDLKIINDTLGHKVGDQYICDACNMICHIFKHSPVFRIGGDEFCTVLRDEDYNNRADLVAEFKEKIRKNLTFKRAVVAIGISTFRPADDIRVEDVFSRADEQMYKNKRELKELM